jgi:uncharacterized membrane protein
MILSNTWGFLENFLGNNLWIFGLLLVIVLTLTVVLVFDLEMEHLLAFFLIFTAFAVWGAIFDGWVLILVLVIVSSYFIYKHKTGGYE